MVSGARLVRALERSASAYDCLAAVLLLAEHDWASATFEGLRCEIVVGLAPGAAAEAWVAALPEIDLPMPRQFARSVRVLGRDDTGGSVTLRVEAVVLED